LDIAEYFKYFCSIITKDARCTSGTETRIVMTKGESKRRISSSANWALNFRKKLINFYI
jgi:hypothetical protein